MSVNDAEFDFDKYDKPGAERLRRRRGEDDDIESDLEEELLGDDAWTSSKKPSEMSDEELNDDLLQSDDEDQDLSGHGLTINASYGMGTSYGQQEEELYTDDTVTLGAPGYEGEGEYTENYSQDHNADQMDYSGEPAEGDEGYQDEVLDLEINEPLDAEFQDDEYTTSYNEKPLGERHGQVSKAPEEEEFVEDEVSSTAESSQVESEAVLEEVSREESEEEDEEDEESGRLRFKSERKEGVVVRLTDAGRKRSNIPETLELSEKAKADLKEFEEQEEKKRQNRYGRGRGGRGGRGRGGMLGYGPPDMRGNRRRMNEPRYSFMGNMNMQHQGSRMPPHQQHHLRPRGPPPFSDLGRPLVQQPLQPLMPPHMPHRSSPMCSQMESPPRMMSPPPPGFPQHSHPQLPPPQPKTIHINPHFRGPSTPVQVPLMPPAQSQPRPAVGPPRFPGQGDFQQHTFGAPQRPPPHMEPYRSQPPPGPQDREPLFMGEHADSSPFPGQPMFEHHGPNSLMNANMHPPQLPGPGHMGFGPPGPAFNQPGHGPLGLFQREPPRHGPPSNHVQGMMGLNHGGPPNQPRQYMGPRQPFAQPRNHFNLPVQYRMQPPHPQDLPHPPHAAHVPQHHHQQQPPNEPRPMMNSGQNSFHLQQAHGSLRQSTPRSQNPQLRNMANRQRMTTPSPKQGQNLPQRNSNLREVPVAPGNANMNSTRPGTAANATPTARAAVGPRPGQNSPQPNRGRGQASARGRGALQPGGLGRTEAHKEPNIQPNTGMAQNAEEDEETRQYRLKIEEQKRLREEILKRKEMRRQMQAGIRKKELLDRLNSNPQSQNQGTAPPSSFPAQPYPPVQQPPQQRPMLPPRQQSANQGAPFSSNGSSKTPKANPPVRTRGPMLMDTNQHMQTTGSSSDQTQTAPLQQRKSSALLNTVRPVASPVQNPAPRPGAKRTVMQRATATDPVPQKVRLLKLSGAAEKGSEVTGVAVKGQSIQSTSPHNLGFQRNVPAQQQNRMVVSGRGRGRGQAGAGRPLPTRQSQKTAENGPSTVSIEGLSSSTTEVQLKNLLKSIGPIEMLKMIPQHRKAIARFSSPQHAASFQTSFHRHMIDLSHIDVSLIDG
ncbi:RNA-binding protein 33 isoform X2 [Eucyclogobius newberryi]|uniref:RNA-binding protein 33 isoform X2 n=1 Tax=Eucyclogobius newberryi TaxID=166745 RepID=UPI003B5C0468